MRRLHWPLLGLLLLLGGIDLTTAQSLPRAQALMIHEPRPSPVLPIALVPFSVGSEVCRNGHQPAIALKVYNILGVPEATLRLRSRRYEPLDNLPMRCGSYVAIWDGTIAGGQRIARPGIYYLRLMADSNQATATVWPVRIPRP